MSSSRSSFAFMESITNTKTTVTEINILFHDFIYPLSISEVSSTSKNAGETIYIDCLIKNHRISDVGRDP